MQEIWVQSLGWEDPLEKEMGMYSSILAWEIPWIDESGWLQSMGSQKVRHDSVTNTHIDILIKIFKKRMLGETRGSHGL